MHEHSDTTFIRRQALYICACAHYCLVVRNSVTGNSIMATTGGSSGGSAHNRLRQQVMNTTSLLLQAVDNLEQQRSTPGRGSSSSSNFLDSNPNQSSSVSISGTPHQVARVFSKSGRIFKSARLFQPARFFFQPARFFKPCSQATGQATSCSRVMVSSNYWVPVLLLIILLLHPLNVLQSPPNTLHCKLTTAVKHVEETECIQLILINPSAI